MRDKNQSVAEKIKEIRLKNNISQAAISQGLNITPTAYNRIENNKTQLTVNNLFKIAETLNTDVEILLELAVGYQPHNNTNIVMTNFNSSSLNLSINLKEIEKILQKDRTR